MSENQDGILQYVKSQGGRPVHAVEIQSHLKIGKKYASEFRRELRFLVKQGLLKRGKKRTFQIPPHMAGKGRLSVARDGYGFVALEENDGPDVFIPARNLGGGCNGDTVTVRILKEERGRRVGIVTSVVKRKQAQVTGTLEEGRSGTFVQGKYGGIPVRVYLEEYTELPTGASVGVEITQYPSDSFGEYVGRIIEEFDPKARVTSEIERTIFSRGLPGPFPRSVEEQSEGLPDQVPEKDKKGREDWTSLPFVTIDGEDARDFDDAVCLVPHGKGRRLYVAVADVSHYVREGSPLDEEARLRGTSAYFPDRVIPMLPEKLSNGLCSLNPHVDRLVMGVWFDIRKDGSIGRSQVAEAVIHSHARLTYTQVARLLRKEEGEKPPEEFHDMLRELSTLTDRLFKERLGAGALDLEVPEAWFEISEDGSAVSQVKSRSRTPATGLIEECMLLANRTVARCFLDAELPSLFRIHEDPDEEKIAAFFRTAGVGFDSGAKVDGIAVQKALNEVENPRRRMVLQGLLLRALQKARYGPDCLGHFGLAFEAYLHFTSPIRRYPDLVVHRLARRHLLPGKKKPKNVGKLTDELGEMGTESSALERRALEAEREIGDALKARYMEDYVGEEFRGMVTSMIPRGLFIRLGDLPVDGFLSTDAFPSAQFDFDPERMWFLEPRSKQKIQLGQELVVVIGRARMEERKIDLELTDLGLKLPPEDG